MGRYPQSSWNDREGVAARRTGRRGRVKRHFGQRFAHDGNTSLITVSGSSRGNPDRRIALLCRTKITSGNLPPDGFEIKDEKLEVTFLPAKIGTTGRREDSSS